MIDLHDEMMDAFRWCLDRADRAGAGGEEGIAACLKRIGVPEPMIICADCQRSGSIFTGGGDFQLYRDDEPEWSLMRCPRCGGSRLTVERPQ